MENKGRIVSLPGQPQHETNVEDVEATTTSKLSSRMYRRSKSSVEEVTDHNDCDDDNETTSPLVPATAAAAAANSGLNLASPLQFPTRIPVQRPSSCNSLSQSDPPQQQQPLGPVVSAVVLLRDWGKYGRNERVGYHFRLLVPPDHTDHSAVATMSPLLPSPPTKRRRDKAATEAMETEMPSSSMSKSSFGVASLLECVPTKPWHKLTKRQTRDFKLAVRTFNAHATAAAAAASTTASSNSTLVCLRAKSDCICTRCITHTHHNVWRSDTNVKLAPNQALGVYLSHG
jgi:hypothetical protein